MMALPAHTTKHLPRLDLAFAASVFTVAQKDDGETNGTALWLGGQCLAWYLADAHSKYANPHLPPRAIELGSGIGLTALALCSLGWAVLATDTQLVLDSVLAANIAANIPRLPPAAGPLAVQCLDWTADLALHTWPHHLLQPPFDLIYSADTVYVPALVQPLLSTFHAISSLSMAASPSARPPIILLCIERRDPQLVDSVLHDAKHIWHFSVQRIPSKHLARAITRHAPAWNKLDWEGVELWKLKLVPGA